VPALCNSLRRCSSAEATSCLWQGLRGGVTVLCLGGRRRTCSRWTVTFVDWCSLLWLLPLSCGLFFEGASFLLLGEERNCLPQLGQPLTPSPIVLGIHHCTTDIKPPKRANSPAEAAARGERPTERVAFVHRPLMEFDLLRMNWWRERKIMLSCLLRTVAGLDQMWPS